MYMLARSEDLLIIGVRAWLARGYFIPGGASQRGGGQAPAFRVARCQTWTGVGPKIGRKLTKIHQKLSKSPKVNMLKFGDVSFDLGFERGKMSATGYVAKISMLRLNIGSGKLSSCMLSIGRGPKAVQGKGGGCPPLPCSHLGPRPMLSMHELSLSMPEPMLSLSMLILARDPVAALEGTIRK